MKKYEHIEKFAKRIGKTRRTIYRFYNKHDLLSEQTKKKGGKRYIPISHQKYWNNEDLLEENLKFQESHRIMKNLLGYLHSNEKPLSSKLWGMDWTDFISVDYKHERGKTYAFSKMNKLYDELEEKFGAITTLRYFFTTEPFANRNNGQHNHIMIYIEKKELRYDVMDYIRAYFKHDRVDSSPYDFTKGGLFYIVKEGTMKTDWDIRGNNLEKDGIKYENKGYNKAVQIIIK